MNNSITTTTTTSAATPAPAPSTSSAPASAANTVPRITTSRLNEFIQSYNPNLAVEKEVEALLLQIADDFVDSVCEYSCAIARNRHAKVLNMKDILYHLSENWQIEVPGYELTATTSSNNTAAPMQIDNPPASSSRKSTE